MGMLLAVQFTSEIAAKVLTECNEVGLLLNAVRPNAVRLMPPLTLTQEEVDLGVERLEFGIQRAVQE
jgi:acetylornithine aminotransferase/acetylornithine/N-succinyldiaminopimelate aminotransferase